MEEGNLYIMTILLLVLTFTVDDNYTFCIVGVRNDTWKSPNMSIIIDHSSDDSIIEQSKTKKMKNFELYFDIKGCEALYRVNFHLNLTMYVCM